MEFRGLRRDDDRTRFACGVEELDDFFRHFAGQNQFKHQIGVTYVLEEESRIAAFVTVAASSLTLPPENRGRLPAYPVPVLLIARLAVDRAFARQKLGSRLLRECCALAVQQADVVGCCGLVTDAKPDSIGFYQRFGFKPVADPKGIGTRLHYLGIRHFRALVEGKSGAT